MCMECDREYCVAEGREAIQQDHSPLTTGQLPVLSKACSLLRMTHSDKVLFGNTNFVYVCSRSCVCAEDMQEGLYALRTK